MTQQHKRWIFHAVLIMVGVIFIEFLPEAIVRFLLTFIAGWQIGTWFKNLAHLYFPDENEDEENA